jgi:hypothetical protein
LLVHDTHPVHQAREQALPAAEVEHAQRPLLRRRHQQPRLHEMAEHRIASELALCEVIGKTTRRAIGLAGGVQQVYPCVVDRPHPVAAQTIPFHVAHAERGS